MNKRIQIIALILLAIGFSACAKKENKSSVRARYNRNAPVQQVPNSIPVNVNPALWQKGVIQSTSQFAVADFLGANSNEVGSIQRIDLLGYVSDGYNNTRKGGSVDIIIWDSFSQQSGAIVARFDNCQLRLIGHQDIVRCEDELGFIEFRGISNTQSGIYSGQVTYETKGQTGVLGQFSVGICYFLEYGCWR